jgi:NTE family protein
VTTPVVGSRTAFVLSGGGSLGAVQAGMLQALGAAGVEPDLLVGTSAGAVNAAWVAGHGMAPGSLEELAGLWARLRRRDVFPLHPDRVLRGVLGAGRAISTAEPLGALVRAHAGFTGLEDAPIELHMVATDLLSGRAVRISHGPVDVAAQASAAVPALHPPVHLNGRYLIDGGVAHHSGVADAVELGATTIWLLPTGYPCAMSRPPRTAVGVALHALTLLIEQQLITEVTTWAPKVTVKVLPPLCPLSVSTADFTHAEELIGRARHATVAWLQQGGDELPEQHRFLGMHHHRPSRRHSADSSGSAEPPAPPRPDPAMPAAASA